MVAYIVISLKEEISSLTPENDLGGRASIILSLDLLLKSISAIAATKQFSLSISPDNSSRLA